MIRLSIVVIFAIGLLVVNAEGAFPTYNATEAEITESEKESKVGMQDTIPLQTIPSNQTAPEPESILPEWVRNIFIWYAEETITENELLNAIQFLLDEGILLKK